MKSKKVLQFNPTDVFDVARAISKALSDLSFSDKAMATRWALEARGFSHPVKIVDGASRT